ncbi:MAG TPA: acyltransferase [Bryobacteraceae bacterium]|nr:acyltransferase [Bryobacteraceae bacterium]
MPKVANAREHLPALTGLRFVLALWVILHHLTGPGAELDGQMHVLPPFAYALIRGGYLAVTTFFVLSGFVLARSYAKTEWTGRNVVRYGAGRLARIYPVYALSLLVVAPFIAEDRTPGKTHLVAVHGFLLQGWLGHLPVSWNTPAWSLSCELFFYLAFPLAAVWIQRANWFNTVAIAAFACCLTRVMWRFGVSDDIKPLVHLSDFLMGIAAACAFGLLEVRKPPAGAWLYVPGFAIAAALIAFPAALPSFVDLNTALRPINALLLIGLALGGGAIAQALSSPVVVYLGKSSYAMYILHVPLLWWYLRWSHGFSAVVYLSIVVGLSVLVYCCVEEPANRWLRTRIHRALEA